jgi:hypothetical protein
MLLHTPKVVSKMTAMLAATHLARLLKRDPLPGTE